MSVTQERAAREGRSLYRPVYFLDFSYFTHFSDICKSFAVFATNLQIKFAYLTFFPYICK